MSLLLLGITLYIQYYYLFIIIIFIPFVGGNYMEGRLPVY